MAQKTFYITTALYYSNSSLHIGHAYEVVAADAMARYKRLRGYDVKFLTGMDEHGQKIEQAAAAAGITPQQQVDGVASATKALFGTLNIDYDIFWCTTCLPHSTAVKKIFNQLYEQGDIYKGAYKGLYCTPCETFYTKSQLEEGNCPVCKRKVEEVDEEAYFFRLSKYQDRLIEHIEKNPTFIMPASRAQEMLNNFLRPGLTDLCVSRTSFKWGIPLDFDPNHVSYVWVDALSNYAVALGFMGDDDSEYKKYWPADVHIVGKDIVRFHTIIWPALLMALDQPLPKQVFGHGWLHVDGVKIGKSLGNSIDPAELVEQFGIDAIRYFLLKEVAFGQDGNYTPEILISRINSDLANDLGNMLSRTVGMIDKYFGGKLPANHAPTDFDEELKTAAAEAASGANHHFDRMEFDQALGKIWAMIGRANKYIDQVEPWKLTKEADKQDILAGSLWMLAECLRIAAILIEPVMPDTPAKIYQQLNIATHTDWDDAATFGLLPKEVQITKGDAMFPRIDTKNLRT
ncbi:MAG: methionine--tRNA ligase [Defluviitaleaceae bacterium]|nr:methionine--tRNA ligase [Defluviitaleaceae bacterium]